MNDAVCLPPCRATFFSLRKLVDSGLCLATISINSYTFVAGHIIISLKITIDYDKYAFTILLAKNGSQKSITFRFSSAQINLTFT